MRAPVIAGAAIGPIVSGASWVPVIVERHATTVPSQRISWTSRRNATGEVKTRRRIAADETHRAIVEAAGRLFAERGYHATSIRAIAADAGGAAWAVDALRAALIGR